MPEFNLGYQRAIFAGKNHFETLSWGNLHLDSR